MEVEELLVDAIKSGSLTASHLGMLDALGGEYARQFRHRCLLHIAVQEGRRDWTEALLANGVDPCSTNGEGKDAVRLATEMTTDHPGDSGRAEILEMLSLARDESETLRSALESRGESSGASEGTFKDLVKMWMNMSLEPKRSNWRGRREREASFVSRNPVPLDPMEAMMIMTEIMEQDEGKTERVRLFYERLMKASRTTSCLLQYLGAQSRVKVHVDFDCNNIGRMKKTVLELGWRCKDGSGVQSFADFNCRKIYLAGKDNKIFLCSLLASEMAKMAIYMAFRNGGRPFAKGDVTNEIRFCKISRDASHLDRKGGLHNFLRQAMRQSTVLEKQTHLISAVPRIIAQEGPSIGEFHLSSDLPDLLEFYEEQVIPALQ